MNNITLQDLYKKAVIKQYEEVKNGEDYIYLNTPTRGKLNKLCWEIFETKPVSKDDKVVFNTLLGFPFDLNTKNKFKSNTNQFRPIETFLKGETDPDKMEVVDLAAILVDFQLRPFNKFRKQIDPDDLELINDLRDTKFFSPQTSSDDLIDEVKAENPTDSEKTFDIEEPEMNQSQEYESIQDEEPELISTPIVNFVTVSEKPESKKIRYLAVIAVLVGLCLIIYLALPQKQCMQWSVDHYDIVSCDLESTSIENYNSIQPYDSRYIDLRKIKVNDTTTFFKNEKPVVWYIKIGDSLECYDRFAPYPENTARFLKPITKRMIENYIAKKQY